MEKQLNQQNQANTRYVPQNNEASEEMISEWTKKQLELNSQIALTSLDITKIRYVAGCKVLYWKHKTGVTFAYCVIAILDLKDGLTIKKLYKQKVEVDFPYKEGFEAFCELPIILKTAQEIRQEHKPDLYLFDGNGLLHERKMGLATHASILLKTPAIGVSSKYYKFDDVDYVIPNQEQGSITSISHNEEVTAICMRTKEGAEPLFISCGNYITLDFCQTMITKLVNPNKGKNPIPLRIAAMEAKKMREKAIIKEKKEQKRNS